MRQARSQLDVRYVKHQDFPNKYLKLPMFEPISTNEFDRLLELKNVDKK